MTVIPRDDLSARILQDIIRGEYKPGDVLSERGLMEKHGVGKSPMRESMQKLCDDGVLKSIARFGYVLVPLTEKEIRDILHFRIILESQCLPVAMKLSGSADYEQLLLDIRSVHGPAEADDVFEDWDNNSRFHLSLAALCGNRYCYDQLKRCMLILKRAYAQFYWDSWNKVRFSFSNDAHIALVEALKAGDLAKADQFIRRDISSFGGMFPTDVTV